MTISLNEVGKRFKNDWIFRKLSFEFESPNSYAILGSNGSGKSTLLKIISGLLTPNEGKLLINKNIPPEDLYKSISFCAPYVELIEELSVLELVSFHFEFKEPLFEMNSTDFLEEIELHKAKDKLVSECSSGMKQRLRIGLAVLSKSDVLLLDEPCTNLDEEGITWYKSIIKKYCKNRLVIVSSNQKYEYEFCTNQLEIAKYKN
jgi:ABC-type multidrug transport system ATPase subunit